MLKLTDPHDDELYIAADAIVAIETGVENTRITLTNGAQIFVKEKPDAINKQMGESKPWPLGERTFIRGAVELAQEATPEQVTDITNKIRDHFSAASDLEHSLNQ